jgi:phage protein D
VANDLYYRVSVDASGAAYDLSGDLSSFSVEQHEAQPDMLTVDLPDTYKVLSHALQEGMDVEAEIGTGDDHAVVFRGRIYKVDGAFPDSAVPTLQLKAYDGTMKMGLKKKSRPFADMALSDIVNTIAADYFTDINVDLVGDPQFDGNGIRQDDETDLAFLTRLAAAYGCVMYVRPGDSDDTFNFIAQYNVMSADPEVTFHYGRSDVEHRLLSFRSSADVSDIRIPRTLSGIDYKTGTTVDVTTANIFDVGDDDDPFFDENLTAFREANPIKAAQIEVLLGAAPAVQSALRLELGESTRDGIPTFVTDPEMATLAQNQFSVSLRGMRASGRAVGVKELFARTSTSVEDVGGRFSGRWYVSQVRHALTRDGFMTDFECRR